MPSVQLLFGPMLIGTFLNILLYGVMIVQIFIYYQTYRKDSTWLRYFVLYLFLAESINTGLDMAMMYEPLVAKYGTEEATTFFPLLLSADPCMTVLISTPIQIFIAWRIRIISRAWWLAGIISLLAFISLGGGLWLTYTVTAVRRFSRKPELHWPALTWLLASAIADVIITASLTISLSRRKTGITSTDDAINKIMRLTVQTGLITAIFAILDVVCFLALPHTAINFVWDFALSKLYTNALLSTLNARAGWDKLANGPSAQNVLFGDEESSRRQQFDTFSSGNIRFPTMITAGTLELESRPRRKSDMDFTISITKEIETIIDPPPPPKSNASECTQ